MALHRTSLLRLFTAFFAFAASVTACNRNPPPAPGATPATPIAPVTSDRPCSNAGATKDPHWVCQATPHARTAVVFVHGIFGDTNGTWANDNGRTFFDLLASAPGMHGKLDLFAFGFTSTMWGGGSLDIREAANKMESYLAFNHVWDYDAIVFVAHSMGGLVTLREVINQPQHRAKVPLVFLFATPTEGLQITAVAQYVVDNPAIRQMFMADGNDFLKLLDEDWRRLGPGDRPHVACAYEKSPTYGQMIVAWSNATRLCDSTPDAIEGANHLTLVKPDRPDHPSVIALVNAINTYAPVSADQALLDMPDFRQDGDHWAYTLADTDARNSARLRNTGARRLAYQIREISSQRLLVWPADQATIEPGQTDTISFALLHGKIDPQYSLVIRARPLPDRTVIVNVPDVQAVEQQQRALVETMSTGISDYLASPGTVAELKRLGEDEQRARVADAARTAAATRIGRLPEGAQWVITADALAEVGWPALATSALRKTEAVSPSLAKSPAAIAVANTVATQSGALKIFDWQAERIPDPPASGQPKTWAYITAGNAARWSTLSERLGEVPALAPEGLNLEGDVLSVTGKNTDAKRAYTRAAELRDSPLSKQRIRTVDAQLRRHDVQG
jgi:pimeloyl-ACP methyl ester carboxylesterase